MKIPVDGSPKRGIYFLDPYHKQPMPGGGPLGETDAG